MNNTICPLMVITLLSLVSTTVIAQTSIPEKLIPFEKVTTGDYLNTIAYPTCHTWNADSKKLYIESTRPRPDATYTKLERQFMEVDVNSKEARQLAVIEAEDPKPYGTAQFGGSSQYHFDYAQGAGIAVYYDIRGHNLYLINVATGKSEKILHEPEGTIGDPPSISEDGTKVVYYVLFRSVENRFFGGAYSAIFYLDVDPKTLKAVSEPKIITSMPGYQCPEDKVILPGGMLINHCQVNSLDKDHIIYSHQYMKANPNGTPLYSRCWQNKNGLDSPINIAKSGEWQTHEVIGPKGKFLYLIERWNVMKVDFKTGKKTMIFKNVVGLNPCHITVSPDEKWIAADLFPTFDLDADGLSPSGLLLVNVKQHNAKVICRFRRGANHPAHPHPNFSPDGKKIAFVVSDNKNSCQVAVADVSKTMAQWDK